MNIYMKIIAKIHKMGNTRVAYIPRALNPYVQVGQEVMVYLSDEDKGENK